MLLHFKQLSKITIFENEVKNLHLQIVGFLRGERSSSDRSHRNIAGQKGFVGSHPLLLPQEGNAEAPTHGGGHDDGPLQRLPTEDGEAL